MTACFNALTRASRGGDSRRMSWLRPKHALHVAAATLVLAACGGGSSTPPPAGATRTVKLSATAVQAVAGASQLYQLTPGTQTFAALAQDVDVVTVFVEHYGIPWDEFAAAAAPPDTHPWTIAMRAFAANAKATGKPLALQATLARDKLAGAARANGTALVVDTAWKPACFDFGNATDGAQYRTAYRRFAAWMATLFQPVHFVHAVEISGYRKACPNDAAWNALVATANDAYDAIKAATPAALVYPSFILTDLYASSAQGFDAALVDALAGLKRDRLGLSIYPQGLGVVPQALPSDFVTRLRVRRPAEPPIVVTETGWNTDDLRVGTPGACVTGLSSSETVARDYLDWLLTRAGTDGITLVTWWSGRDLLPADVMAACYPNASAPAFAACNGDAWCGAVNVFRASTPADPLTGEVIFKAFGTMGLRRYDGTAKPALLQRWQAARAVPLAP